MPDLPPVASLLVVLLIAVMLVFALGTQRNIRRGNQLLVWLQDGLPLLGARTGLKWLGSTAVVLRMEEAREPFRSAEVVVVLKPRDVTFLWAWARARGRTDFLVLRGNLRRPPRFEVEAGDSRGWTGHDRLRRLDLATWLSADWGDPYIQVAHSVDADPGVVWQAWQRLTEAGGAVWRISVRRDDPHVEVHLAPPDPSSTSSARLIEAFRSLAGAVAKEP